MTRRSSMRPMRSSASTHPPSAGKRPAHPQGHVPETLPDDSSATRRWGRASRRAPAVPDALAPGDHVLLSCVSACGRCRYLQRGALRPVPGGGGWIFGHTINGVQAEFARVPFADNSVYKFPQRSAMSRCCSSPTSCRQRSSRCAQRRDLARRRSSQSSARDPSASLAIPPRRCTRPAIVAIDLADTRLESALRFGADITINNGREDAVALVMELTDGSRCRVALEAVGVPQTFELATE